MSKLVNILIIAALVVQQTAYAAAYLYQQGVDMMKGWWYYGNSTAHIILFAAIGAALRYGGNRFTGYLFIGAAALPLNQWWDEMAGYPGKWGTLEWVAYGWLALWIYIGYYTKNYEPNNESAS